METTQFHQMTKEAVQGKFRSSSVIKSRYIPMYPDSAEREMKRIAYGYMRIIADGYKSVLPEIMRMYEIETRTDSRMDGIRSLRSALKDGISKATSKITKGVEGFFLRKKIEKTASSVKKFSVLELKRSIERTLGVEVMTEYYRDEMYADAIRKWIDESEQSFKDVPKEFSDKVRDIVEKGYRTGASAAKVKKEIQHAYSRMRRDLSDIAAGGVSVLNYECTKRNQTDSGVVEYIWKTRHDGKVRPCHASFDGRTFRWDDPPEIWRQKSDGTRIYEGRRCHPGQDYNCRCISVPCFDINRLSIPIAGKKEG